MFIQDATLTKLNVKQLRTADTICFSASKDGKGGQITSHMTMVKKENKDGWGERINIEVDSQFQIYNQTKRVFVGDLMSIKAFMSVTYANSELQWQTIARSIKEGDKLRLLWVDQTSEYLR